jgi:hypothetical protein
LREMKRLRRTGDVLAFGNSNKDTQLIQGHATYPVATASIPLPGPINRIRRLKPVKA